MCGIAGTWNRDGRPANGRLLEAMTASLQHRGPDGAGHYVEGSIAIGHRRPKIINLSAAAEQRAAGIALQPQNFLRTVTDLVWYHDAPIPIRGRYSQWHLMRETVRHVTVLLGGQGADELLGGYSGFVLPYLLDRIDPRLATEEPRRRIVADIVQMCRISTGVHRLLPRLILAALRQRFGLPWPRALTPAWSCGPVSTDRYRGQELQRPTERPYASRLNNSLWAELRHAGLPESLHAEDAISMAFSVESRMPFLDHRLVELCFALPYDQKIRNGWSKWLLRDATAQILPEPVRWRRHKLGFPGDYDLWLAGAAGAAVIRDVLLDRRTLNRGVSDADWLRRRSPPAMAAVRAGS
ncbi:MAG: asparagine synthetase B family protein [Pseudomonadota bacterium]|nr:asparagine synthetase B family protein [Pseudomonadota bacterium]